MIIYQKYLGEHRVTVSAKTPVLTSGQPGVVSVHPESLQTHNRP